MSSIMPSVALELGYQFSLMSAGLFYLLSVLSKFFSIVSRSTFFPDFLHAFKASREALNGFAVEANAFLISSIMLGMQTEL